MKNPAKTFDDLVGWQKSHSLVLALYRLTQAFPRSEIHGTADRGSTSLEAYSQFMLNSDF